MPSKNVIDEQANCQHTGQRHATYEIFHTGHGRRMEWCTDCGALLRDREYALPLPGDEDRLFWCNTHQRRALCLKDCYQGNHYKGGITLACKIVDLTGLCEIVEDSAAPWTPAR
jgi:hypothetical protein